MSEGREVFSDLPSLLVIFLQSRIEIVVPGIRSILRLLCRLDEWSRLAFAWEVFYFGHVLRSVSAFQCSISGRSVDLTIPKEVFS